jgi:shikimate kinase
MKAVKRNIVLIGMPGSGKTAIGRLVAEGLGLQFYDVDEYIEDTERKSIKEIFTRGEDHFRDIESAAIKEISGKSPAVIATGGGAVKRNENMEALKGNSIIIFLNRPLENIIKDVDMASRPLLAGGVSRIYELYEERYHLYKKYSDYEILNDAGFEDAVDKIMSLLGAIKG